MKEEFGFTGPQLRQAAGRLNDGLLASLPKPEDCPGEFSPAFEENMEALIRQTQRAEARRRVLRRAAAACLAAVLSISLWLTVDVNARAAIIDWWAGITDRSTFGSAEITMEEYLPGWLPDDSYVLTDRTCTASKCTLSYESSSGELPPFQITYTENGLVFGILTEETGTVNNDFIDHRLIQFTPDDPAQCKTMIYRGFTHSFSIAYYFEDAYARLILENMRCPEEGRTYLDARIPAWVPEDYSRQDNSYWDETSFTLEYEKTDWHELTGYSFTQSCYYFCTKADPEESKDNTSGETVLINGSPATLTDAVDGGKMLTWTVDDLECSLIFKFDLETAIRMAESTI